MLDTPVYSWDDLDGIAELVRHHPWSVVASSVDGRPVISHAPVLLDGLDRGAITVSSHLGRQDGELHRLGEVEMTIVIQGPHGYVSPAWYGAGSYVPTWNYVVAHLHGRAEVLTPDGTWDVLVRTVERMESERPRPWSIDDSLDYAHRIAPGTVGFRLTSTRVEAKAKLSQDKPDEVVRSVVRALESDDVHADAELAATMRAHLPQVDGADA